MSTIRVFAAAVLFFVVGGAHAVPDSVAWNFWRAEGTQADVDHSAWQTLLDDYVIIDPQGVNRVRYGVLGSEARPRLRRYLDQLAAVDPRSLTRGAQQAYWINLYNALTIETVLDYPRKKSILRMGRKLLAIGPWDDHRIEIAGQKITLNDIEHRILRPLFGDERVHFAVNCASVSCPNIAKTAYTAGNLDELLDTQVAAYLKHPRGLRQTERGFELSTIFDWYRIDFAADEKGLREWLAARRPDIAPGLQNLSRKLSYEYNWDLNAAD